MTSARTTAPIVITRADVMRAGSYVTRIIQHRMKLSRLRRVLLEPVTIRRCGAHVIFASVVWPVLTIAGAAYSLKRMPYYTVSWREAFLASAGGLVIRLPDLILVGLVFFGLSAFIFRRFAVESRPGRLATVRLFLEPMVTFVAACMGIALWYPGVLSQALFLPLDFLPVAWLLLVLAAIVAVGVMVTGRRGRRLRLGSALFAVGLLSPGPLWLRTVIEPAFGAPPTAILLGVDSISLADDLTPLTNWVTADGGTWYERAVTPGLFTNAVWTSILAQQPVRTHRIFHTFQRMRAEDAVLLHDARRQGYRTIGMFSDQLTAAPGPTAGFDENRSGPMGWRQLLLPMVANNSLLVPVIGSALPRPWPGASQSNEGGTFTYDLGREVRSLLRAGEDGQRTFVAGHLTYVHLPVYPSVLEMSAAEFQAVLRTPANLVRDRTIDWQDLDRQGDQVPLNSWKIHRVQSVIQREVADAGYLQQGGQLILFSDHGSRNSLNIENFQDDRYHHVVLATFGVPPRCPKEPVSLIDIGRLFGFSEVRAEPTVEFVFAAADQWPALFSSARFRWSGQVDLDEALLAQVFGGLRKHTPWPTAGRCEE